MAFNAFMKFDPDVQGEAQDTNYANQIEIYSFSWGASNPTTVGQGGGSSAGKVDLSSFNIMKKMDKASPTLFQNLCAGKHFNSATVNLCKQTGDTAQATPFLTYVFQQVYVNNVQWSGSEGGDDTPTESVSFSYAQVVLTYSTQDASGNLSPSGAGWNILTNAQAS